MKKTMIFIVLFASYILAKGQDTSKSNKPIETGFVFIDGKYIEPPYMVEYKDEMIYINNIAAKKFPKSTYYKELTYDKEPGIPLNLSRNASIDEFLRTKDAETDRTYLRLAQGYYYTHFTYYEATAKVMEYIKKMPNIKNCFFKDGGIAIESNVGEIRKFISIGMEKQINDIWGPNGSGPPSDTAVVKPTIDKYRKGLLEGNLLCFFNQTIEKKKLGFKALNIISEIVDMNNSEKSVTDKLNILSKMNLFSKEDSVLAKSFIQNFAISPKLNSKIIQYKKNKLKNKNNDSENNEKKDVNENQLQKNILTPNLQKSAKNILSNSDICYSPSGKQIVAASPIANATFTSVAEEIQVYIENEGYNEPIQYYQDFTQQGNSCGTLTYANIKDNFPNGDVLYFLGHGLFDMDPDNFEAGIVLMAMPECCDIYNWLSVPTCGNTCNNCNLGILANMHIDVSELFFEGEPIPHWCAVALPEWFSENWKPKIDSKHSILFLGTCSNARNLCLQACTEGSENGGVAFGYYNAATVLPNSMDDYNISKVLERMNGVKDKTHRSASDAYRDNWEKQGGFTMYPPFANITLCPGLQSYFPSDGSSQTNAPTKEGYFEFDTWCEQTDLLLNSPLTLTVEAQLSVASHYAFISRHPAALNILIS